MALLPPNRIQHLGINVFDLDKMVDFYCDTFGFVASDRGTRFNGQKLAFLSKSPNDHHQFVLADGRPPGSVSIINQISFECSGLDDLRASYRKLVEMGITEIIQVNHGNTWSVYFRDPEGNLLELFVDAPWHTPQPARHELDITRSNDAILADTEAYCRSRPGFMTREEWSKGMAERIQQARA